MDIVDTQLHLGPGGIDTVLGAMDALGIRSALIDEYWVGAPWPTPSYAVPFQGGTLARAVTPTAELAALTHPDRFSYLLPVLDRRDPELDSQIRLARDAPYARALRITPGLDKQELSALASGAYDPLFKAAADCGLPIFVTIPGNAPALRDSIEKFPSLTFIIDHCGMPFPKAMIERLGFTDQMPATGGGTHQAELEKVLRLADLPNVALKWAHAQGLFGVSGYPFAALRPFLRSALDAFGAERVMWAGDASVVSSFFTGESWGQLLFCLMDNPDLSQGERAHLLGGTARKVLNWPA